MYRVELKVLRDGLKAVEVFKFLMYRVELKGEFDDVRDNEYPVFLMYRVELKVLRFRGFGS